MSEVIEAIALISEFMGTIFIGFAVLKVHTRVGKEHKIDKPVIKLIQKERTFTIIGLLLITIGFILNFV